MDNLPAHLQRIQSQHPDLAGDSAKYTFDSLPRKIPLSRLPGQRLYDSLQSVKEFNFIRTNAEVTFDLNETGEWLPQYYIGGGGFGDVGVYMKRDANGKVIDEIALKEVHRASKESLWPDSQALRLQRRLLAEAAMHVQLNQSKSESKDLCTSY